MALIDLKSDLSKFRADFNTPSLENKVNASNYNIDDRPKKHGNDVNQTNFKDISGANFNYPNLLINGKRLWEPAGTKNSQPVITFPGPQNFLNDSTATGFTLDMYKTGQSKKETQFKSYFNYADFKSNYRIADVKSTGPTGWQPGNSTLISQLGTGKPDLIKSYDSLITKTYNWYTPGGSKNAYHSGFHNGNRYSVAANINSTTERGFLAATYNTNSPIDDVYKKYNLRDEAHNTTYMPQPYILRGIQRKGNEKPQYWGFGSKSGFDDGLIRGGVVTVADRIVADTVRIAKFMASPKGLLWIVKQIGLGLTNPKVETIGGPLTRQTRIHTGVASLLSVPGTALGLHFTRHGIPFANEIASYENVIKFKQIVNTKYSRLGQLMDEFDVTLPKTVFEEGARFIKVVKSKTLLNSLSDKFGGPGSVYGIGPTSIRRVVDTVTDAKTNAETLKFYSAYHGAAQYASGVSNSNYKSAKAFGELNKNTAATVDELKLPPASNPEKRESLKNKLSNIKPDTTPGAQLNSTKVDLSTAASRAKVYTTAPKADINSYTTLAYGKLKKNNKGTNLETFNDFRVDLDAETAAEKRIKGTGAITDYYKGNNLEDKYGFSKSKPTTDAPIGKGSFIIAGNKFNRNSGDNRRILATTSYGGDRITATDIGTGGSEKNTTPITTADVYGKGTGEDLIKFFFEDGDQGYNVMPFRCTMTGFSDSFSPGWDRIDIMGRPDGAYLYSSFERAISFTFTAAALNRSEMIPMWRKLNYLASYTMPDFNAGGRPSGPFMRITIGDLFQRTPGFLTSLTYSIPDDATWDTASDSVDNKDAKQLPMMVEASVSFTIVSDYRPQMMGRVYSLSPGGKKDKAAEGQWLADAET